MDLGLVVIDRNKFASVISIYTDKPIFLTLFQRNLQFLEVSENVCQRASSFPHVYRSENVVWKTLERHRKHMIADPTASTSPVLYIHTEAHKDASFTTKKESVNEQQTNKRIHRCAVSKHQEDKPKSANDARNTMHRQFAI